MILDPGRATGSVHHGYYVDIPDRPSRYDKKGVALFEAATNLPDSTLVDLYYFSADEENPAWGEVKHGHLSIGLWNRFCHETERGLEGSTTRLTVTVRAEYQALGGRCHGCRKPPPPVVQPPAVRAVLGPHFERLAGDQIRVEEGEPVLTASKLAQLPADTCVKKIAYTGNGSFEQVPVDRPISLPTGPFPKPPFRWCPDAADARPVEAGDWSRIGPIAEGFDKALTTQSQAALGELRDASVTSYVGWTSTGSAGPTSVNNIPSGYYTPAVPLGCGALVALRTVGATLAKSEGESAAVTYLLILRSDGWKVWGELPGDGR